MKPHKLFFTISLLFIISQFCFGQDKAKAISVSEFGKINCEMLSSHLDALSIPLRDNENFVGYIVIFGNKNNAREKYDQEYLIQTYADYRKMSDKFIFVHGKDQEAINTQLWLIPTDAEKPVFEEQEWDYYLSQNIKPFIIESKTQYDHVTSCDEFVSNKPEKFTATFLLANPNINAHLVIYSNSVKKFQQTKNKLINEFTKKYKIPHNRLKVFSVKKTGYVDLEFWLVPKKNSN